MTGDIRSMRLKRELLICATYMPLLEHALTLELKLNYRDKLKGGP